ncbi:MAG TPA: hypothetical protein VNK52_12455 [Hyphomicrobiaceae bacterium]|nr:hypothetical protein [Hyphomicrobiaceae bacterium]
MVLRKTTSTVPRRFLFNGAVALFVAATAGLAVQHMLATYSEPPCAERYTNAMLFSWQRPGGEALSAADLQARLGGSDWGLLDNVRFVRDGNGPAPVVLEVSLSKPAAPAAGRESRGGMGFRWLPSPLERASAACLTYGVWLPSDLNFAAGGSLPGLFGGDGSGAPPPGGAKGFATRLTWGEEARADVHVATVDAPEGQLIGIDRTWFQLPTGRWVNIEQEIVLNHPGAHDGILRIWIDGHLKLERKNLAFRGKADHGFKGVIADVHYGKAGQVVAVAGKDTAVRLSPFELRWR